MTEQDQPKTEQTKNATLKVVLDHSYQEQKLREELDKANQENTKNIETIKALLVDHKEKFESETNYAGLKNPTVDLNSNPPLEQPKRPINMEGSSINPNQVCADSVEHLFDNISKLSHVAENRDEFKKVESKLLRKMLHNPKPLDLTFKGSSIEFLRHPKIASEFASEEEKRIIEQSNNRQRINRQKWVNGGD
jgi:hypothetical protein